MARKLPIIAIVGRANVGKSSLFNNILKQKYAVVAKEAGTTRDSIAEKASYRGNYFWLVDTAGAKDPEDQFELTIQDQIKEAVIGADVIWMLTEANIPITDDDRKIAKLALRNNKRVMLVINKIDQAHNQNLDYFERLGIKDIYKISVVQNKGIEVLLENTLDIIPQIKSSSDVDSIKVSLIGRPNVGKSSLFNTLARKQQAIVADKAGTTRDVNKTSVRYNNTEIEFMDTAGIRRNGKIQVGVEKFSVLRTLWAIEKSNICLLLIDANELNVKLDEKLAGLIKEASKGLIIVITKWDAYEEKTPYSSDSIIKLLKNNFDFVPWAPVIFTSSVSGQNVTKLFDLILEINHNQQRKLKTSELNSWLKQAIQAHPPAGLKNRNPKLNYITQEKDNTIPSFKIFGSQTKFIHWSYKRYLEHSLRDQFDFSGCSVELWFIEKNKRNFEKYNSKEE